MNTTNNFYIFEDICQDSPFWNDEVVSGPEPKFTECFQTTVLEWLPFLWLVLSLPVYPLLIKYYLLPAASIPFSTKSFVKTALCLFLFILSLLELWSNGQYGYFCDGTRQPVPAFYLGLALRCVSIVIVAVLIQVVRIKGVVSSAVIFIYWLAMLLCAIIPLQTAITYHPSCASSILKYLYFITLVLQTILHCFADKRGDYMQQALNSNKMGTCPDVDSSFPSRMIFFWMLRMVYYNFKKPIKSDEMWAQTPSLKYSTVVGQLSERWKKEVDEANRFNRRNRVRNSSTLPYANGYLERGGEKTPLVTSSSFRYDETLLSDEIEPRRPSLYRALFHTFIWDFLFGGLYNIVAQSFILLQPLLLREIVNYVDTKDFTETQRWVIVLIALGFYISGQMESISFHQSIHTNMSLGLKIKTSLIGMIYEKSLKLSSGAKRSYTVGEIVNLMSVDCQRIQDAFGFGYAFFALFIVGLVGFIELYYAMGLGVVGGAILVTILAVANVVLAKFQEKLQRRLLYFKGNRIKLFNEVIEGIKVIKMFAWEKTFSEKVLTIRNMESHYLRKIGIVTAWTLLFSVNSPFFAEHKVCEWVFGEVRGFESFLPKETPCDISKMNYAVLLVHVASDFTRRLTPGNVFLVLNVVNIFRFPVTILPFLMTGMIQTYVSVGRIQHFLWGEELNTSSVEFVTDADHAIRVNGANFSWDKDQPLPTLRDINLKIKEGSLVAVVGTVGSGKSTLINSLLGETEKIRGRIQIKGSLAYVPQEAWIQNLTLRENILYGSEFKERKYWKVVEACALQPDLKILAAGDQTEIGQKGLNLSGGQKQRVSLARAVYSNSDIYLLDDPLSAVDPHVGKELFTKVIGKEGLLKNKTRILVTHGVHWLPYVDSIVVMDNGQISEMGSYDQLMRHNGPFAKFLESYLLHEPPPGDDTDPEIETVKDQIWEQIEHVFTQSEGGLTSDDGGYTKRHGRAGRRRSSLFMRSGLFSRATSLVESLHRKEEKAQQQAGQLIQEEEQEKGGISWSVVFKIAEGMGLFATFVAMMAVIGFQAVTVAGTYWLSDWSEDRYLANETNRNDPEYAAKNKYYLVGYTLFGIAQGICIISFGFIAFLSIVKANKSFHSTMLNCVLRSPMSFFDTTPNGRIMNRFSSDMDVMDDRFPRIFRLWAVMITTLIADVIVIAMKTPQVMYIFVPAAIIYFFIVIFYLPAARQLKRAESVLRTPVYNHFSETITGATVIRAFKSTDRFIDEIRNRVDRNCAFYYTVISAGRWISIIAEGISNIIVLTTALFAVSSDALTGGDAGLSLSYAVQIVIALNLAVLAISEMQMNIVSSERIVEYTKLDSEAEWVIPSNRPPSNWPNNGVIKFKEYTTRYRPGLELVLRGISCKVKSGEKVGIVGRTGAGKSSMTLSLFRLIERAGGRIKIDDVDISTIGLHDLRSKITILPQDPVLFTGSLRSNLDPLDKFDDDQIWRAIECAHLKNFVNSQQENMYYDVGEAGGNLSVGQRQLVCLGRALLHKSKILILDEATAAVDMETDELIQQTLKTEFWDCTVLTIAHRLNTILDYDRVMVLDKGLIVEFDTPKSLMDQPDGIFYGMAREADLLSWFDNRKKQN